jgi:hypothetical protein
MPKKIVIYTIITLSLFSACTAKTETQVTPSSTSNPTTNTVDATPDSKLGVGGHIKTGKDIGKNYCQDGLYLSMSEGPYYLLKAKGKNNTSVQLTDQNYAGREVLIKGTLSQNNCKALTCECEPSLVIDEIFDED